eukprot:scaffold206292_cov33-Tisochrysis_lutea.AAC.2
MVVTFVLSSPVAGAAPVFIRNEEHTTIGALNGMCDLHPTHRCSQGDQLDAQLPVVFLYCLEPP